MRFTKWLLIPIMGIFCSLGLADIRRTCPSPICILTQDREWRHMNQTFVVNLLNVRNPVAIYVINKNTTSIHTVTLTVFSTPSPSVADYTNNTQFWVNTATTPGSGNDCSTIASIAANSMGKCSISPLSSAQVAIQFSGATLLAGTPDTADVYLVQGSETIGAVNTIKGTVNSGSPLSSTFPPVIVGSRDRTGSARMFAVDTDGVLALVREDLVDAKSTFGGLRNPINANTSPLMVLLQSYNPENLTANALRGTVRTGLMVGTPLQIASDSFRTAFTVGRNVTNPVGGDIIFAVHRNSTPEIIFDRAILSCTAACRMIIQKTTSLGTTCTVLTPLSLQFESSMNSSTTLIHHSCAGAPTRVSFIQSINIAAGESYTFDLQGIISALASGGLSFEALTALTGDMTVQVFWHEAP